MRELPPSTAERDSQLEALRAGLRYDLRGAFDIRPLAIAFGPSLGHSDVRLGATRVLAHVSARIVRPRASDPNEGFLLFSTECSPMASPAFEVGKLSEEANNISRILDRTFLRSRAVDTEGLCIVSGEKVWEIRIDMRLLDLDGNAVDCACIAAVAALLHFRRPDVTVSGEEVTVHSLEERNPVPLSVHHVPICTTFAIFDDGRLLCVDPTNSERACQSGEVTLALNSNQELCSIVKSGGSPLSMDTIIRCSRIAGARVADIAVAIQQSLKLTDSSTGSTSMRVRRKGDRPGV